MRKRSAGQVPAIVVEGLRKDYGTVRAVDGVSFQVRRGEIYALLGPNGAGKTSTVEILEGHRRRTSGSVRVLGFDPGAGDRHFRERVGIVLQSGGMDAELTVREMVSLFARFYARPRAVAETIEQVGLAAKRRARVRTLSGGQVRRLDLALALIGDPEVLFLDEPTTGFDPNARRLPARSATRPPYGLSSRTGRNCAAVIRPSIVPDPVSFSSSHDCATACIHVPARLTACPAKYRRRFRTARAGEYSPHPRISISADPFACS